MRWSSPSKLPMCSTEVHRVEDQVAQEFLCPFSDDDAALLARPDIVELIQQDPSQLVEAPIDTTAESAATDLACLALHQARISGDESAPRIKVSHPRFAEAVAAAIAAGDDEQQAFETASGILKGPEAAEAFGLS